MNNSTVTFDFPPQHNGSGTVGISSAQQTEFTAAVVQRQREEVKQVGLNAHMDSMTGITLVAYALLDMLSNALEFGNARNELADTFRQMLGLKGARATAIAREKATIAAPIGR